MKNQFYFKKKAGILLLSLCAAVGLCAQNPIVVLEAENADSVHAPAKVKSVDGFSGGKYVGGNDPGSYLFFHDVEMDEAGTYEFKTYFNCNGTRRFTVKVNNYPEVECSVKGTAKWDMPPAETTSVLVYMAAGKNNIKITPYPTTSGGPNLDKFEILETTETPLPVPHEGFPIVLEAEYAHLSGTLKVKTLEGMSNDRYVGDFNKDTNSALQFTCIDIPEEGPYELKIFTNDPMGRPLDIQTNNYAKHQREQIARRLGPAAHSRNFGTCLARQGAQHHLVYRVVPQQWTQYRQDRDSRDRRTDGASRHREALSRVVQGD